MGQRHLQHQLGGQIEIVGIVAVGRQHQRQNVPRCALALPAEFDADLCVRSQRKRGVVCLIDVRWTDGRPVDTVNIPR